MAPATEMISEELFQRIQGEFLEMPGLRLTPSQAPAGFGAWTPSCAGGCWRSSWT
jgi:hypothetical protein